MSNLELKHLFDLIKKIEELKKKPLKTLTTCARMKGLKESQNHQEG